MLLSPPSYLVEASGGVGYLIQFLPPQIAKACDAPERDMGKGFRSTYPMPRIDA